MTLEEDLQKALEAKQQVNQNVEALKQRIMQGESLGDPVKDAVFLWGDYYDLEKDLRGLQKNVAENQGKQVLALYTRHIKANDEGCVIELFDRTETNGQQLGIIAGELYFDFLHRKIIIPTQQYAHKGMFNFYFEEELEFSPEWKRIESSLAIPHLEYVAKHLQGNYNLELLFGDEVELYFTNSMYFDIYKNSKDQGEDPKAVLERCFQSIAKSNYVGDPEYVQALNVLNIEVPARFRARGT